MCPRNKRFQCWNNSLPFHDFLLLKVRCMVNCSWLFKRVYSALFLEIVLAWRQLKIAWHERECFCLNILFLLCYRCRKIRNWLWSSIAYIVGIMHRQTYVLSIEPSLNLWSRIVLLMLSLYFSGVSAELLEIPLYSQVPFYLFPCQKGTYNSSCIVSGKRDFKMRWEDYHRKLVSFFHSSH